MKSPSRYLIGYAISLYPPFSSKMSNRHLKVSRPSSRLAWRRQRVSRVLPIARKKIRALPRSDTVCEWKKKDYTYCCVASRHATVTLAIGFPRCTLSRELEREKERLSPSRHRFALFRDTLASCARARARASASCKVACNYTETHAYPRARARAK